MIFPERYVLGEGQIIVLPARVCHFLIRYAHLEEFWREFRGRDAEIDAVMTAIRVGSLTWQKSATGTVVAPKPELNTSSEWLSTGQVADRLRMTDRGVRRACAAGRLQAVQVAGRWRITREAAEHFKTTRK